MITQEMLLIDIVEAFPETEHVFHEYDAIVGKCLLCNDLFDSMENVARKYSLNLNDVIDKLNSTLK